jgi:hypothetical protein
MGLSYSCLWPIKYLCLTYKKKYLCLGLTSYFDFFIAHLRIDFKVYKESEILLANFKMLGPLSVILAYSMFYKLT